MDENMLSYFRSHNKDSRRFKPLLMTGIKARDLIQRKTNYFELIYLSLSF